jgi:hypothetical protein
MSLGDWFRRLFSSPAEAPDDEAVLREEYGAHDEGESHLQQMPETTGGGAAMPGLGSQEGAETAQSELESLEPPPDQSP